MYFKHKQLLKLLLLLLIGIIEPSNTQLIRNEGDIAKAARGADRMRVLTQANGESRDSKPDLLGTQDDIAYRADQALHSGIFQEGISYNVSGECLKDTETLLESLIAGEMWALKMIDAMGKPASGILEAHFTWLGQYDECRSIKAVINTTREIKGKYCKTYFGQQPQSFDQQQSLLVTIGICIPNSCNNNDGTALVNTLLSLLPVNTSSLPQPTVMCQEESIDLDTKAIVVIVVCSIFGLVMVAATAYDVLIIHWLNDRPQKLGRYEVFKDEEDKLDPTNESKYYGATDKRPVDVVHNNVVSNVDLGKIDLAHTQKTEYYQPGILGKLLLSFSVYTNLTKLLNTNQPAGTLSAINGIRFLSMTWVLLGHSYGFGASVAENMATFMPEMLKRFTFQAIANATVSVDTFFTLSGLLVAYLTLKEIKKRGGIRKMNWGLFYFHRFWRLTPPYMLFLMFYVCLGKYWGDGPNWPQSGLEKDDCKDTWWKNLLYINNIVDQDNQCMGWSWYLANDMQFYIVSPLMLIPLYYSPFLGAVSCLTFLLVSFISTGVISSYYELGANIIGRNGDQEMEHVYMKPWCRIGPYAVGVFTGYILYRTNCKLRMPKILALIGWLTAAAIALAVLYGLYDESGFPTLNVPVSAFYNATSRSAWGLAVCWVIVACATGNGGFINSLLSWKAIIPLSRLTYCSYLVHLVVMDTYFLSKRSLLYLTDLEEIYMFFGHLCSTYIVALVVSMAFEAPMMGLEKVLLGRNKRS